MDRDFFANSNRRPSAPLQTQQELKLVEIKQSLLSHLSCPICKDTLNEPITNNTGHTYCNKCFSKHFQLNGQDSTELRESSSSTSLWQQIKTPQDPLTREEIIAWERNKTLAEIIEHVDNAVTLEWLFDFDFIFNYCLVLFSTEAHADAKVNVNDPIFYLCGNKKDKLGKILHDTKGLDQSHLLVKSFSFKSFLEDFKNKLEEHSSKSSIFNLHFLIIQMQLIKSFQASLPEEYREVYLKDFAEIFKSIFQAEQPQQCIELLDEIANLQIKIKNNAQPCHKPYLSILENIKNNILAELRKFKPTILQEVQKKTQEALNTALETARKKVMTKSAAAALMMLWVIPDFFIKGLFDSYKEISHDGFGTPTQTIKHCFFEIKENNKIIDETELKLKNYMITHEYTQRTFSAELKF